MIADIVPITRIRRNTSTWSYQVPRGSSCIPGQLVRVQVHGRSCLGVIWAVREKDEKATALIEEIITTWPLLTGQHRELIEWRATYGLCSLSTSLFTWLPAALRGPSLTSTTKRQLAEFSELPGASQQALVLPVERPDIASELRARSFQAVVELFGQKETEELTNWLSIRSGKTTIIIGRERALCAPFLRLQSIQLREPEHISYHLEQSPRVSIVEATQVLAKQHGATLTLRSYLPHEAALALWPEASGVTDISQPAQVQQLRDTAITPELITGCQQALQNNQRAFLVINAHDRVITVQEGGQNLAKPLAGAATLAKQLAKALGQPSLPISITLGTRSVLQQSLDNTGFSSVLALDPVLQASTSANHLHGIADLGRLLATGAPLLVQARTLRHPLVLALAAGKLEAYTLAYIHELKESHLPPFSQQIALVLPQEEEHLIDVTLTKLQSLTIDAWQVGGPDEISIKGKPHIALWLHHDQPDARIPAQLRTLLIALPKPWQVWRNPWFLL